MDGVMNMNKFDKMVECNRRISIEKIDLARKTILDMVEEGERVTFLLQESNSTKTG